MKKSIKTIIVAVLAIIACLSFVLMFAETEDGSINLAWSIGCMASLAASGRLLDKMGAFKEDGK